MLPLLRPHVIVDIHLSLMHFLLYNNIIHFYALITVIVQLLSVAELTDVSPNRFSTNLKYSRTLVSCGYVWITSCRIMSTLTPTTEKPGCVLCSFLFLCNACLNTPPSPPVWELYCVMAAPPTVSRTPSTSWTNPRRRVRELEEELRLMDQNLKSMMCGEEEVLDSGLTVSLLTSALLTCSLSAFLSVFRLTCTYSTTSCMFSK